MYSKILTSNNYGYNKSEYYSLLEEYIKNIGYGSKEALSSFYQITKTSVYGFALSILRNQHDAEDVLQEVYIKIYESASTYQANGKPLGWILTITKNLSLMKLRKQKNNKDIDEMKEFLSDGKDTNDAETKLLLSAAFEIISDEERNILILHAVSGFRHREISKLLDMPLSTVLSKYNRAIKKIKKAMSEEGKDAKKRN
ncbi:MAG: RNA polymerase sigma factor [Bacilli bacterium]|nr:RNA polymerase sigma factor [Bacilli bacterium]